ncbi:MAG TPA: biopolymer transporter ExbD [Chthoniobacteraceae bacterium]|nr:biopolymer transporter ExbD [Chthoniobacteraceae bacterium]
MASVGSEDGDVGFQIAPMVDVVFVLMLFFMASAGSQVVERELSMNLPGGTAAAGPRSAPPTTPIMVDINSDGSVLINNRVMANGTDKQLNGFREWFRDTIDQFGDKDPVIIRPTPDTQHERIMDVLNAAGASGVTKLTFG